MGWHNGPPSWTEMERVLTGKPRRAGRATLAEPNRRRRRQPGLVTQAGSYQPPRRRPAGALVGPVCRAARAFGVQLSRRRQHAGGTRRGSRPARPARHRADRPRRALRGGAIRRGGQGTRHADGVRCRIVAGQCRRRTEEPDPPGPHLLVLARGPEGYRRLSRAVGGGASGRRRKGQACATTSTRSPRRRAGTGTS